MNFLQGFLTYLRTEKRYSDHTIKAYQIDLHQYIGYLGELYDVSSPYDAKPAMIRSWVMALMDNGMGARSVNRKLSALKSYYRYLRREGLVGENPLANINAPRIKSRLPAYVEKDDMSRLLDADMFDNSFGGIRNRLIVMILYYTGMRRSELLGLKLSSYDRSKKTLKVLGKGNKERIIPINRELSDLIDSYYRKREGCSFRTDSDHMLVTDSGSHLYPNYVYRIVRDHLAKVSTAQKKSPHVLRHTFATHMLNNGADLNSIKEILGHANLSATQIYTHNSVEQLKQIYKQAHPKA